MSLSEKDLVQSHEANCWLNYVKSNNFNFDNYSYIILINMAYNVGLLR